MAISCARGAVIVLDLDGVLVEVAERYFRVHQAVAASLGRRSHLSKDAYWTVKREAKPLAHLLQQDGPNPLEEVAYRRSWMAMIEAPEFLAADTLISGAREALVLLKQEHPLVLVTLRQRADRVAEELERLQLTPYFAEVHVAAPGSDQDWEAKRRLVERSPRRREVALLVGDTEVDIRAGKALGLPTVAVLSGIRSRARLAVESPDAIVDNLAGVVRLLKGSGA